MRKLIILLIALIMLFTNCNIPKECGNCFKETRELSESKVEIYLNEFDSMFQNNYAKVHFTNKYKDGSISQAIFLEVDLENKNITLITNDDKYQQGEYFREYAMDLLGSYENAKLVENKNFIIPIVIYKMDSKLNKIFEEKDCKYYHKKIKQFENRVNK